MLAATDWGTVESQSDTHFILDLSALAYLAFERNLRVYDILAFRSLSLFPNPNVGCPIHSPFDVSLPICPFRGYLGFIMVGISFKEKAWDTWGIIDAA